jgi:hypothetical protein
MTLGGGGQKNHFYVMVIIHIVTSNEITGYELGIIQTDPMSLKVDDRPF